MRDGVMPPVGTKTGKLEVQGMNEVSFNVFLSSGARPHGGWPIVIYGGGQPSDDIWGTNFNLAATMAKHGLAIATIQSAWHGFGPLSTVTVSLTNGDNITFPAGGRNSDKDDDGDIEVFEGIWLPGPLAIFGAREAWRQTIADTMQFVRIVETGMDVDGDGVADLDPSRIYYLGHSGGTWRGVAFVAVEPAVRAAVFNAGSAGDAHMSPVNRPIFGTLLATHMPSLINPEPAILVESVGGIKVNPPLFNENLPLRDQPPVVNTVSGAIAIQRWLDRRGWLKASAEPGAFAPYLRKSPLAGLPPRPVIVSFAKGDQLAPNPDATALVRAGDLADRTSFFRNDLAFACDPTLEKNAHTYLLRMNGPARTTIALVAQEQTAIFLASDGSVVIDPDDVLALIRPPVCGLPFFEVPITLPLPEDFGYIP